MGKTEYKYRVVLEGGKLLGSFLYFKDKDGRGCFKFSLKPKLGGVEILFEEIKGGKRRDLTGTSPIAMSVDVSYKFADNLLEFKTQGEGKNPKGYFMKMPSIPETFLFSVRLKNWEDLPTISPASNILELKPPASTKNVAIIFSFINKEGKAVMDRTEYLKQEGRTIVIKLPHNPPFDKILIGVVPDPNNMEPYDFTVKAPNYPTIDI